MRWPWRRRAAVQQTPPAVRVAPSPAEVAPPDVSDLEDQARYHRDRLALYRARMHGAKPTSVGRLEELQRAAAAAQDRLRAARGRAKRPL